jgi:hypothetical protein
MARVVLIGVDHTAAAADGAQDLLQPIHFAAACWGFIAGVGDLVAVLELKGFYAHDLVVLVEGDDDDVPFQKLRLIVGVLLRRLGSKAAAVDGDPSLERTLERLSTPALMSIGFTSTAWKPLETIVGAQPLKPAPKTAARPVSERAAPTAALRNAIIGNMTWNLLHRSV